MGITANVYLPSAPIAQRVNCPHHELRIPLEYRLHRRANQLVNQWTQATRGSKWAAYRWIRKDIRECGPGEPGFDKRQRTERKPHISVASGRTSVMIPRYRRQLDPSIPISLRAKPGFPVCFEQFNLCMGSCGRWKSGCAYLQTLASAGPEAPYNHPVEVIDQ